MFAPMEETTKQIETKRSRMVIYFHHMPHILPFTFLPLQEKGKNDVRGGDEGGVERRRRRRLKLGAT